MMLRDAAGTGNTRAQTESVLHIGELLAASWKLYASHFVAVTLVFLVPLLVAALVNKLANLAIQQFNFQRGSGGEAIVALVAIPFFLLPFTCLTVSALNVVRGTPGRVLADVWRGCRYPLAFFEAALGICWWVALSGLLLFIPAPRLIAKYSQGFLLIVDRDVKFIAGPLSPSGATVFSASSSLTSGNIGRLILLLLIALAMAIVGALPYGVGLVLVLPYLHVLGAVIYVTLVNADRARQPLEPAIS